MDKPERRVQDTTWTQKNPLNETMLEAVLKEIQKTNRLLQELLAVQNTTAQTVADNDPWPVKLSQELMTGEDMDGNGLVYGEDFSLNENASSAPPIFQASMLQVQKAGKQFQKMFSWEEYRDTLPDGPFKNKVGKFVEKVGKAAEDG